MMLDYSKSTESERLLNDWIEEKCADMDLILVNKVPILAEDCLAALAGSIFNVKCNTNKLIVTTKDGIDYILEIYDLDKKA